MDDKCKVFGVKNSGQLAQCCLKVKFLECVVRNGFNWICGVYFSLENKCKSFKYKAEI